MLTKSNNLSIINNYRIKFSSYSNIRNISGDNFSNIFVNNKLINLNVFDLKLEGKKKIKYSLVYTNPFVLDKNIVKKIKFSKTKNRLVRDLCDKIFCSNKSNKPDKSDKPDIFELSDLETRVLANLVAQKNKYSKYIEIFII